MLCSAFAAPALAQTPAVTVVGAPTFLANGPYTLGFAFSTSKAFSVTGLGVFDANGDGLVASYDVGLWSAGGTLLASTTVASGTSAWLVSGFRFNSVSPFNIAAGTYRVGALFNNNNDASFFGGDGIVSAAAGVTYLGGAYAEGGTLADPDTPAGGGACIHRS